MYLYGFKLANNDYKSLSNADGVMTIDGSKVVLKPRGSVTNQKWVLVPSGNNYLLKNVETSQYVVAPSVESTSPEPLVTLTTSETTATQFTPVTVVNRRGRTYVLRSGNADISVKDNLDIVMSKFPATRGAENNDEWMFTAA